MRREKKCVGKRLTDGGAGEVMERKSETELDGQHLGQEREKELMGNET